MRYLIWLLLLAVLEARRITRGIGHSLFPNFHSVYHGNGATSYQHVQIHHHHDTLPEATEFYADHQFDAHLVLPHEFEHHSDVIPIVEEPHVAEHLVVASPAPYVEDIIQHVDVADSLHGPYDFEHEYAYHP